MERIGLLGPAHRGIATEAFAQQLEGLRVLAARAEAEGTPLPELERQPVPRS